MTEVPKPPDLARRGGAWFERGDVRVHLGVEKNFQPARKAHVGFLVDDIRTIIAECGRRGLENVDDGPLDATLRSGISRSPHRLCQRRHPWAGSLDAGSGSCL